MTIDLGKGGLATGAQSGFEAGQKRLAYIDIPRDSRCQREGKLLPHGGAGRAGQRCCGARIGQDTSGASYCFRADGACQVCAADKCTIVFTV